MYISLTKTKSRLTPKQIIGKGKGLHNWLILIKIHSLPQKRSSITLNSLATTYMNKIGILKTRKKSMRFQYATNGVFRREDFSPLIVFAQLKVGDPLWVP